MAAAARLLNPRLTWDPEDAKTMGEVGAAGAVPLEGAQGTGAAATVV
jgi:hypothetical protein